MKLYGYLGNYSLGNEPCGTSGKVLFEAKSINSIKRTNGYKYLKNNGVFRLYTYTNFYDIKTFKEVTQ